MNESEPASGDSHERLPANDAHLVRGALSDDHQWRWDGERWQPAAREGMPAAPQEPASDGHLSASGQWMWDGNKWQPVGR